MLSVSPYYQKDTYHKVDFYKASRSIYVIIVNTILILFLCASAHANPAKIIDGELHTVKPRSGDGLASFLARYEMTSTNGMKEAFLQLNSLTKRSQLYLHKKYTLPVHLYNYDGKSIRTTIGLKDWEKAVRIKKYNEGLLARGARSTHFTKSKILWVPSTELDTSPALTANNHKSNPTKPSPTPVHLTSSIDDAIYGKKYAKVEIIDQELQGKVFYVVSGHGHVH